MLKSLRPLRYAGFIILISLILVNLIGKSLAQTTTKSAPLKLKQIASGFTQITDVQFLPNDKTMAVVLEKTGHAWLLDTRSGVKQPLLDVKVATDSELGLLGFAFHPKFSSTRKVYAHYNPRANLSRISEWTWTNSQRSSRLPSIVDERVLLEVAQPYKNHNGGDLAFGPDGFLYIGFGDGGFRGDPENRAQNLSTLLGKMLRIDVNGRAKGLAYAIPKDNPFISSENQKAGARPEIFALGLRNPWKFSFDRTGRLITGDVGQNKFEEITFVPKGGNLGWRVFEASHCYLPPDNCKAQLKDAVSPIAEYAHDLGGSVTGGFQYEGKLLTKLKGRYFFGDFVSGAIWSIELPSNTSANVISSDGFISHGKFEIAISTFAKDHDGELYVADFNNGTISRLEE